MRLRRTSEMEHEKFDLTPMIDIVLLLIIFFTLTAQFASATRAPLDLPDERGRESAPESPSSVVIDVDEQGGLRVLGAGLTREQLIESLRARPGAGGGEFDVVIRAHRACAAAHVNRLVSALGRLGVRRWRLATDGEGAAAPGGTGGAP